MARDRAGRIGAAAMLSSLEAPKKACLLPPLNETVAVMRWACSSSMKAQSYSTEGRKEEEQSLCGSMCSDPLHKADHGCAGPASLGRLHRGAWWHMLPFVLLRVLRTAYRSLRRNSNYLF